MAENIRNGHPEKPLDDKLRELIKECKRQEEPCRYTAANLYIWQKHANRWRVLFLIAPILLGGFASSHLLVDYWGEFGKIFAAFSGLAAGFFPAIYIALNMDMKVVEISRAAGEFTRVRTH